MRWLAALLALQVLLAGSPPLQTGDGGEGDASVAGQIVNESTDRPLQQSVETMLHVLGPAGDQLGMLHGRSGEDGIFTFEGIPRKPGASVVAMATYKGTTYRSEPVELPIEGLVPMLVVPAFDTTQSARSLAIDSLHVILGARESRLYVTELYVITNEGPHTVVPITDTDDGEVKGLRYFLPPEAAHVDFPDADPDRFATLEGGFLDRTSLIPGERSSVTVVQYDTPYKGEYLLEHELPLRAERINLLVPREISVRPTGAPVESLGTRNFPGRGLVDLYAIPSENSGEALKVRLRGELTADPEPEQSQGPPMTPPTTNLPLIGVGLGLISIGVSAWWLLRARPGTPLEETAALQPED